MRILGIDPGVSTGIVLWDSEHGIIARNTLVGKDPVPYIDSIIAENDIVVIEDAPLFGSSMQSRRYGILLSVMVPKYDLYSIRPTEWKPIAKQQKWDDEMLLTQHEKDAYCLARYCWTFKIPLARKIK